MLGRIVEIGEIIIFECQAKCLQLPSHLVFLMAQLILVQRLLTDHHRRATLLGMLGIIEWEVMLGCGLCLSCNDWLALMNDHRIPCNCQITISKESQSAHRRIKRWMLVAGSDSIPNCGTVGHSL